MANQDGTLRLRSLILDGMESGSGSEMDDGYFDRLRSGLEAPSPETTEAREESTDDQS